ncbi:calcium-binding protein [Pseudomonas sp. TH49]|uniref:calcium-binding protein n=1 Tax=Pseudomonas sp. TH49 TaxID=2796413 RepID=UPI0019140B85|nr:calcium-binding protein [Pseudomonas sp. TH49]MBK5345395.1 calcium-binding protein [Pseudomonas sp. TH49]
MAVVNGTSEADILSGTDGNDELHGLESDDQLLASAGSDLLDGGEGFDTANYYAMESGVSVEFGTGAATVAGPDGKVDTLVSVEKVAGSYHNDTFTVSVGGVTLDGSGGDDLYIVDAEGVTLIEENYGGYDELRTSLNTVKMDPFIEKLTFTGTGDLKVYGNASDNEIIAGAGNDWLWGGAGADHFVGGDGYDTVSYSDSLEGVRVEDFTNYDGLTIAYGDTFTGIEAIQGSGFDDVIYRHQGSMVIDGADGHDTVNYRYAFDVANVVIGGGTNAAGDTLLSVEEVIGSTGADRFTVNASGVTVAGGHGDDVYVINSTGVTVEEDDGFMGGTDHVFTSLSELKLSAFVENLTYTGTADFTGYGNDEANTIVSGAGNDVLLGGAGGDRFEGGAGIDIVSYDDSTEGLSASLNWGPQSGIALYDIYIDIEGLRGSQYNDSLQGNSDDNILEGGAGDDQITGGDGNDHIYGGLASGLDQAGQSDSLSGGAGDDVIVGASNDLFTWASGDDGNDTITLGRGMAFGGEGNDVLTATGSNYVLNGDGGNDLLILNLAGQSSSGGSAYGGQGDDTYVVNTSGLVTIQDYGLDINDTLILNTITNASQLNVTRIGDDAYLHSANDGSTGVPDNGVKLAGWYAGFNTIEHLQTADGQVYDLPATVDGFAMFG